MTTPNDAVRCLKVWSGRYEIHAPTLLGFVDLVGVVQKVDREWAAQVGDHVSFASTMRVAAQSAYDQAMARAHG